ncbi:MAG TPA: N-acetylmuramoyl-L-alanine amidase [Chloroflexota bacterium]|nr:N-acetylmuramoyl-L-alanine amidase [Chloroflexota bacterium]
MPAVAPAPTPSAAPSASGARYTVKAGDTLFSIARSFGVSSASIQEANGITDPSLVKVGQLLVIPGAAPQAASTPPAAQASPAAVPAQPSPTPAQASPIPAAPAPQPAGAMGKDPLFFEETGFRIANDQFWNYFNRRGGIRTFGYPISKEFLLLGFRVQLFQRSIMQLNPDGSVTTMNLLDDGLMPYTRMNGSSFPAPDAALAGAVPAPGSDAYFDRLLQFVKERSPDQWSELGTNFNKAFNGTVLYEEAYPDGKQDPGIMPAINLELWGVPTSAPAYDPTNKNFVYLRFQRGIMHFDKTNGTTQGLLLGEHLKSIITGVGLPPDLEEQAKGSRFYRQYNPTAANGLARPNDLPGTDMRGAFSRDGLVVVDPGHGGTQVGAAHVFSDVILVEKDLNLKVAQKTADILRRSGRQVMLTRTSDSQVNNPPRDVTGDGKMTLDDDLQARVDFANTAGAAVFLSIHFNGNNSSELRGMEVYYNTMRPFSDKNRRFAQTVLDNLIASTKAAGYNMVNRGIKPDETAVGKGNSFYLLGPADEDKPRATQMVGVLGEGAFLTNLEDAEWVKQEKFLDALAAGYARAVDQYMQSAGR